MKSRCRTIPPISCNHFHHICRVVGIILVGHGLQITLHVGASIVGTQPIGIFACQDGISTIHCNSIDVHSPAIGHGGTGPPLVKVAMHTNQPASVPIARTRDEIMLSNHARTIMVKTVSNIFHHTNDADENSWIPTLGPKRRMHKGTIPKV